MEHDLLKRIETLEEHVRILQTQVTNLETEKATASTPLTPRPHPETTTKIADQQALERSIYDTVTPQAMTQQINPEKQGKTFEQWIAIILPKVFIIILALGVLWGLKVASDFGYFNDTMKIILGFISSIMLFSIAYWMEKKQKGALQVALMLYGGAFIVGILTTAAGAILYEVLHLYVALIFALLYIAYGVAISYRKGAESLTALVALTSFLLPYLLEYMDFNPYIIVAYIVLLFVMLQLVIWKHEQKYALYVGTFFSVLALMVTSNTATDRSIVYGIAIALVATVFLAMVLKLFSTITRKHNVQVGFIFSLLLYIVFAINLTIYDRTEAYFGLTLLVAAYIVGALAAKKAGNRLLFDVTLSATFVAFLTFILNFNNRYTVDQLLIFVTIAIGLLLAIRLRVPIMQVTYSFLFAIVSLIIAVNGDVYPFWSIGHLTYVLVVVALILLYIELKKPLEEPNKLEVWRQKYYVVEWVPIALYLVILLYSMHMQDYYLQYYSMTYLALLLIVVMMFVTLFIFPVRLHVPMQIASSIVFGIAYFILALRPSAPVGEELFGTGVRVLFVTVVAYALFDFIRRGIVYEKLAKWHEEYVWIGGSIAVLFGIFCTTNFMAFNDIAHWNVKVIVNTIAIFTAAAISLTVGGRRDDKKIRLFGVLLLIIGIVKLIFFDLSTLDVIIRSILFIVIGGAGLVLTNKLLTKKQ